MTTTTRGTTISPADNFIPRHVGPNEAEDESDTVNGSKAEPS